MPDLIDVSKFENDELCRELAGAANAMVATYYGVMPLSRALTSSDIDIYAQAHFEISKLGDSVLSILLKDKRFPGSRQFFARSRNSAFPFYPELASRILIRRTIEKGSPDDAVAWLQRVLAAKQGTGRVIEALWGVPVDDAIELVAGTKIVPFKQLPDSPQKRVIMGAVGDQRLPSMLNYTVPQSALLVEESVPQPISDNLNRLERSNEKPVFVLTDEHLADVTLVLTLVGPRTPISAMIWFDFDDPDLSYLSSLGLERSSRTIEILPSSLADDPALDPAEAAEVVQQYLKLPAKIKGTVRVATHRLNIAQRRASTGDKAIDLCIALESLLGGAETNEVTHKVTTRAVRLLGGSEADRLRRRDVIKATYGFRSKMVHQGAEPTESKKISGADAKVHPSDIVREAVDICAQVIKLILRAGKIPDWTLFDVQEEH